MPGYLDHVLARAFGADPVLRPRPRSRFEPATVGLTDLTVWPESTNAPTEGPVPGRADGPAWHQSDPGLHAVPGSAPEPWPGKGQARAPATPLAEAGPEPSGDAQTVGPFGIKEPDTERTSSDQPPTDPVPRRASPVTAGGTPARISSAAASVGSVTPTDPAPAILAAHGRPSRPPARRPVRRFSASDGEPSPVPAAPTVLTDPPMAANMPVLAASWDVADAPVAVGRPIAAGSLEPAETSARADPLATAPSGPPTAARTPTGADQTDMTADPLADLLAIASPVTAAPTGAARRPSPNREVTSAPVVNVTIGRVEVRPPPAPPAPAPPVRSPGPRPLSLDEYLERRNSGPS